MPKRPMTPSERALTALNLGMPDEVPTFELEFQLAPEFFGREIIPPDFAPENYSKLSLLEKERLIDETADFFVKVYTELDYAIMPAYFPGWGHPESFEWKTFVKRIRERVGNTRLLGGHGDGTFSIPDGNQMYDFAYRIADDPEGLKAEAQRMAERAIEMNKRNHEAGLDVLFLCSDYCYNSGPFLSPEMFREFITPYLYQICEAARRDGIPTIKHTDGNIMPILDQLVECKPNAIHSLDPMAGVDIREVKKLVGNEVCLCGNVNCALMQTGTDEEVIASAEYCLKYGKEGGGYIFCTSNVPFRGMPPERYKLILDIWKKHRKYEEYDG